MASESSQLVHLEQFREHARIEALLFDGTLPVRGGAMAFEAGRGLGLVLRDKEAARHAA